MGHPEKIHKASGRKVAMGFSDSQKKYALLMSLLASFLTPFIGSSVNIALPSIAREFNIDAILLSWVPTSYLLTSAILLVPFGRVADIYGRKRIFTSGIIIYTAASLFSALSTSGLMLIFFRILQGIGSAMIFGNGVAIITSVFPPNERGKALGINIAGVSTGLTLGPFLGGYLTQYLGWRSIFFFNIPFGIVIMAAIKKLRGEWAEAKGERFDFYGSAIFCLSLIAIIYGFSILPAKQGLIMVFTGAFAAILFVIVEGRAQNPVLNINLFRNRTFALNNLAALMNYNATISVIFLMSLYLQYIKGFPPKNAGMVLFVQPLFITIFSPVAGKLSDKVDSRLIASAGMFFTGLSVFLLTFLQPDTPVTFVAADLSLLGFGLALFASPNTHIVMSSVERKYFGVASATVSTMRVLGQMFGMGIAMLFLAIYIGSVQISPENYSLFLKSIKMTFFVIAAICFAGIFASLVRKDGKDLTLRNQKNT